MYEPSNPVVCWRAFNSQSASRNRAMKAHFPMLVKCQPYRSNTSLINYTENLWTSKCHPETPHLTELWGGCEGMILMWQRTAPFVSYMERKRTFIQVHWPIYQWHTPVPKKSNEGTGCRSALLSTDSSDRSGHPFYILLIASEPQPALCKNKLTRHPVKWSLWNGNVCRTKVFAERLFVFVIFHCAGPWMIDFL